MGEGVTQGQVPDLAPGSSLGPLHITRPGGGRGFLLVLTGLPAILPEDRLRADKKLLGAVRIMLHPARTGDLSV